MVNQYILKEIIIKINDVHQTIREALEVIEEEEVRSKLNEIYNELGEFAERIVSVLSEREEVILP